MKGLKYTLLCSMLVTLPVAYGQTIKNYEVVSPSGLLALRIETSEQLSATLLVDGEAKAYTPIGLEFEEEPALGLNPIQNPTETRNSVDNVISVVNGENSTVTEKYNEMTLDFGEYSLICRAYDEGVAYRIVTDYTNNRIIKNEIVDFTFEGNPVVWFSEAPEKMNQWELSYERYESLNQIPEGRFSVNPLLIKYEDTGLGLTIIESDIYDYPGMFLKSDGKGHLIGKWAQYPKTIQNNSIYDSQAVLTRYDYIARVEGKREYPWRGIIVSRQDVELLNNDLIYKLADSQKLQDVSWIKAGKSGFEWLTDGVLEGVDIPNGPGVERTLEFYKYYVDFCAEYGLEYMTCDAGWSEDYMAELCQYAAERNVKIFVWDFFNMMLSDESRLDKFKKMGIAGVKVDFIARDDQVATGWLYRMAELTAKRQMLLLMHGCPKPTGLHRTYPNIINYEAVHGEENNKWEGRWCNPDYRVEFPYLRMLGGPVEATPGLFSNRNYKNYTVVKEGRPYTMGTRTHTMAQYVVFHQTMGFISDSPVEYRKYPDLMDWLKDVPTVWDETLPIAGEIGEYILMARRSGDDWYVGALNNMDELNMKYGRDISVDFSFLQPGVKYRATIIKDTERCNTVAEDYAMETQIVTKDTVLDFWLANGGGLSIHLSPEDQGGLDSARISDDGISLIYDKISNVVRVKSMANVKDSVILDLTGRVLSVKQNLGNSNISIPVPDLTQGVYICTVTDVNNNSTSIRFFKN